MLYYFVSHPFLLYLIQSTNLLPLIFSQKLLPSCLCCVFYENLNIFYGSGNLHIIPQILIYSYCDFSC